MKKRLGLAVLICCLLAGATCLTSKESCAHWAPLRLRVGIREIHVATGGGSSASNALVKVYREDGSLYQEGRADEKGRFLIEGEEMGLSWRIVAEHTGHTGESFYKSGTAAAAETPLYNKIVAAIGYVMGFVGIALGYLGLKARQEAAKNAPTGN